MSNTDKRFCTECGNPLPEGAAFCTECGTPVADQAESSAAPVQSPATPAQSVVAPAQTTVMPVQTAASSHGASAPGSPQGRNKTPLIIAIVVAAVAVIALIVVLAVMAFAPSEPNPPEQNEVAVQQEEANEEKNEEKNTEKNTETTRERRANTERNESNAQKSRVETPAPSATQSQYILPDSDSRYYSAYELNQMSLHDLYLARNEIFARHGRKFMNADLQSYFNGQPWYSGVIEPGDFDEGVFNDYERKNAQLMLQIEQEQNSPYLNP